MLGVSADDKQLLNLDIVIDTARSDKRGGAHEF